MTRIGQERLSISWPTTLLGRIYTIDIYSMLPLAKNSRCQNQYKVSIGRGNSSIPSDNRVIGGALVDKRALVLLEPMSKLLLLVDREYHVTQHADASSSLDHVQELSAFTSNYL